MTVDAAAFNAFERRSWECIAPAYREGFAALTGFVAGPLLDAAEVGPGDRLLDAGTGPGFVAAEAVRRGAEVVGVDVSAPMVALAAAAVPEARFHRADLEALPLSDGRFDAAVANFVILHVGRPERAAAELARVVRGGGRVALSTWDLPTRCRALGVVLDALAAAGARPVAGLPDGPPFFRFAEPAEFATLLRGAGLTDVRIETVEFGHRVRPDDWWRAVLTGTARTGPMVRGQDPVTQERIRAAYDELVAGYALADGTVELPAAVRIAVGRRP